MSVVSSALESIGPARSSRLAEHLVETHGLTPEAARQRLSRAKAPVARYPLPLFPRKEAFLYLLDQRNSERYWDALLRDLRETGSVYGAAIDAVTAFGGIVPIDEFPRISGAPLALKKQIPASGVAERLVDIGVLKEEAVPDLGPCYQFKTGTVAEPVPVFTLRMRRRLETIMLDGLREWARKNGLASYDKITIRGDDAPLMVGQFQWDLTGPCYLLPMHRGKQRQGFLVADAFADFRLDAHHVAYFIRKVRMYTKSSNSGAMLPLLLAQSFTGAALSAGHAAGIIMATPSTLFGTQVARGLTTLMDTLKNAAAMAAANPDRVLELLGSLSEIEGRAGNLRGVLFEFLCGHLAKKEDGGSIDLGIVHAHRSTANRADLDIVSVQEAGPVHIIECKGKEPGGQVSVDEVDIWLKKLPIHQDYPASREHLRERDRRFSLWTSGTFSPDAQTRLEKEKKLRTKNPIDWRNGQELRAVAAKLKLKTLGNALDQHFLKHPLAKL